MGASLNLRPDLYKAAILGVPFVDVLTTMLDDTIPLTTTEVIRGTRFTPPFCTGCRDTKNGCTWHSDASHLLRPEA